MDKIAGITPFGDSEYSLSSLSLPGEDEKNNFENLLNNTPKMLELQKNLAQEELNMGLEAKICGLLTQGVNKLTTL